jgi:hypothetical protein
MINVDNDELNGGFARKAMKAGMVCFNYAFLQIPGISEPAVNAERRADESRSIVVLIQVAEVRKMRNESKDHRKYVNMYLIDCRTGEESSGCSCLERGRRDKAGGSIGSEDGLV